MLAERLKSTNHTMLAPQSVSEIQTIVREMPRSGHRLRVTGRNLSPNNTATSKDETSLSLQNVSQVIDYPARDQTITIQAGMTVANLQKLLATQNQRLPIDVARPEETSIGSLLAQNLAGSRQYGYGTLRDYLIGIEAVDGNGRCFQSGGRVVKNVAGYDLCKLLIGSRGRLGIITQATFKLRPNPEAIAGYVFAPSSWEQLDLALTRLNSSATRPVAIDLVTLTSATSETAPLVVLAQELTENRSLSHAVCVILFEGSNAEVDWQMTTVSQELSSVMTHQQNRISSELANRWIATFANLVQQERPQQTMPAQLLPSKIVSLIQSCQESMRIPIAAFAGNGAVWLANSHQSAGDNSADHTLTENWSRGIISLGGHLLGQWTTPPPGPSSETIEQNIERQLSKMFDPDGLFRGNAPNFGARDQGE